MNADDETKAFILAKQAASIDFAGAMRGLLAGHAATLAEMRAAYAEKDRAFLMALALTEKGARLDPGGNMMKIIAGGLRGKALSPTEQRFVENATATLTTGAAAAE